DDLHHKLQRLFRFRELFAENQALRRELSRQDNFDELVGSSKALEEVQATIRKVAATHSNVLLEGETGTGKELFARVIHRAGPKSREKFLAVHCSTQPVELLEAQLFGQRKGAFPGAQNDQPGILLHAGEGTVFLDEVGQLPLATQSKLLRAIEFQEIMPLGGTEPVRVAARIIATRTATRTGSRGGPHHRLDGPRS